MFLFLGFSCKKILPSQIYFLFGFCYKFYKGQVIRLVMVVFCKKIGLYRKRFDSFTAQETHKILKTVA